MSGPWFPYCGPAPLPGELLSRWNFDPILIAVMVVLAAIHYRLLSQSGEFHRKRGWYAGLWLIGVALFVSPLCALPSALFSARVVHHVLLIAVAAPIAVLALPERLRAAPVALIGVASALFVTHTAAVWVWHFPTPYAWALSSDAVFWVMQITLLGSAIGVWSVVLSRTIPLGFAMAMVLGTMVQMGLLGAVITFARHPLYLPHFSSTQPFGLTALADQQLAGLIMWVPAAIPYFVCALALLGRSVVRATNVDRPA